MGGRGITIGKHGRIQLDGMGDKEFDSVGDFVHDEPAIAAMVVAIVTVVFLSPVLVIALVLWYRMRKARMLNETMLKLAEKGIVPSADALDALSGGKQPAAAATYYEQAKQVQRRAAWSDLRKGVILGGVGIALTLLAVRRPRRTAGLVLIFVGAGFLVLWFEERQLAPPTAPHPAQGRRSGVGHNIRRFAAAGLTGAQLTHPPDSDNAPRWRSRSLPMPSSLRALSSMMTATHFRNSCGATNRRCARRFGG
jgi:hypothetical protein